MCNSAGNDRFHPRHLDNIKIKKTADDNYFSGLMSLSGMVEIPRLQAK